MKIINYKKRHILIFYGISRKAFCLRLRISKYYEIELTFLYFNLTINKLPF